MNRAEAIKYLEVCLSQVNHDGIISIGRWRSDVFEMAISALRAQQEALPPPCYQPDVDGCAYQIYGENNDEPIDRCKACPLCYTDKVRHQRAHNAPLTLDELREMGGEPYYHVSLQRDRVNHWAVLDPFVAEHIEAYHYGERWLAYRRKPDCRNWQD